MAWFTDEHIQQALLQHKLENSNISIEILIDDNKINRQYFSNSDMEFSNAGIKVFWNKSSRLLHDKFMLIDDNLTVMGSYNYTQKARRNYENVAFITDVNFCSTYSRRFEFLKGNGYIDQNIKLLFAYPDFCQKLLSTYYPFSRSEFKVYKNKITLGVCFSHFNGSYNEITYEPGFIFNEKVFLDTKLKEHEFGLPVTKQVIKDYKVNEYENNVYSSYQEQGGEFDEFIEFLEGNLTNYDIYFERKIDTTYSSDRLEEIITGDVDLVIEEEIWINNFELFINKTIAKMLFDKLPIVKKDYDEGIF